MRGMLPTRASVRRGRKLNKVHADFWRMKADEAQALGDVEREAQFRDWAAFFEPHDTHVDNHAKPA